MRCLLSAVGSVSVSYTLQCIPCPSLTLFSFQSNSFFQNPLFSGFSCSWFSKTRWQKFGRAREVMVFLTSLLVSCVASDRGSPAQLDPAPSRWRHPPWLLFTLKHPCLGAGDFRLAVLWALIYLLLLWTRSSECPPSVANLWDPSLFFVGFSNLFITKVTT